MNPGPYSVAMLTIKGKSLEILMALAALREKSMEDVVADALQLDLNICMHIAVGNHLKIIDPYGITIAEVPE
jgi:hypothetical protein